jgi:hypothetical protein
MIGMTDSPTIAALHCFVELVWNEGLLERAGDFVATDLRRSRTMRRAS